MVAYAGTLPYQTGADRPCELDVVWCAFADEVDRQLKALQDQVDQLEPAVPAAQLVLTTPFAFAASASFNLPFDAAVFDTDDMINFDDSVYRIKPTRPGLYVVTGWCEITGGGAFLAEVTFYLSSNVVGGAPVSSSVSVSSIGDDEFCSPGAGTYYLRATTMTQVTQADIDSIVSNPSLGYGLALTVGPVAGSINEARLSMYKLREVV